MQADHVLRTRDGGGNLVDIKKGRIGGQYGITPAQAVQFGEHCLLDGHVLEHGFDDQVRLGQRFVRRRTGEARQRGCLAPLRQAAGRDQPVIHLPDIALAACQAVGVTLHHGDVQPRIQQRHRDAGAHGAAADDADGTDRTRRAGARLGDLAHPALGKKGVDQPLALRAVDALQEALALDTQAFFERQLDRGLHRIGDPGRCDLSPELPGQAGARRFQRGQAGGTVGQPLRLATAAWRRAAGRERVRPGHCLFQQVALDSNAVDQAQRQRLVDAGVAAAEHQVQRRAGANQARQALRAAGAGQQAQLHLGQPEPGARGRHAVVRRQRKLQPAAQRHAVQRGNDRPGAGLDRLAHLAHPGPLARAAEFADVGAGTEAPASAVDDHGTHAVIGLRRRNGLRQAAAHGDAQRVDGRILQRDDGYAVAQCLLNNGCHAGTPSVLRISAACPVSIAR
ncbi:hypothetical protein D9M72_379120 [compost metagenome]